GSVTVTGLTFQVGALYQRTWIHDQLGGGSRQSGITRVKSKQVTLIFTGISGRDHGYFDSWDEESHLHYYGHGQLGDMELTSGNDAIANHRQEGRRLLVFQALGKRLPVRFLGEFRQLRHYRVDAPDR